MKPISSLSREPIRITVFGAAGVETVEIAFTNPGSEPAAGDWKPGSWTDIRSTRADARIIIGPGGAVQLADGTYQVWVRVTGQEVQPVLSSGLIDVI